MKLPEDVKEFSGNRARLGKEAKREYVSGAASEIARLAAAARWPKQETESVKKKGTK